MPVVGLYNACLHGMVSLYPALEWCQLSGAEEEAPSPGVVVCLLFVRPPSSSSSSSSSSPQLPLSSSTPLQTTRLTPRSSSAKRHSILIKNQDQFYSGKASGSCCCVPLCLVV
ncbi:hypothetical protein BP00DRAFT_227678 [Aspergillus indologenus CBS 114.80]|uniref:Uncharacterized protein n=1 Tax=Aspergillus indologenus CBS 114.80 TaxID=1450541 RepID=A0A2V5I3I1_9EURO|nr:hypothetical protein BP00DRAFT_227678 [Aspergillus indologenus CBS 114.80]